MSYPVQGIVPSNWANYPHSEITERIVDYREERIPFAEAAKMCTPFGGPGL